MTTDRQSLHITSPDPATTHRLGQALGRLLQPGDVVCLSGELGAGKTALTRGIGAGWGALERVTSPTFTLVHEHARARDGAVLYHVDCYRLAGATDAETIGLDDMLHSEGVIVIEWPEQVAAALPDRRLWIRIQATGEHVREFTCEAQGTRYERLLDELRADVAALHRDPPPGV